MGGPRKVVLQRLFGDYVRQQSPTPKLAIFTGTVGVGARSFIGILAWNAASVNRFGVDDMCKCIACHVVSGFQVAYVLYPLSLLA